MSSISYSPKDRSYQGMSRDLIEAASKLNGALVEEISKKINWLYLDQPMLLAYQEASSRVFAIRPDSKDIADQRTRVLRILNRARAEFIKKEERPAVSYDSD